jgi:hypothetical protein
LVGWLVGWLVNWLVSYADRKSPTASDPTARYRHTRHAVHRSMQTLIDLGNFFSVRNVHVYTLGLCVLTPFNTAQDAHIPDCTVS